MEHLEDLLAAPKTFVKELIFSFELLEIMHLKDDIILSDIIQQHELQENKLLYDYDRFINEELTELTENHALGLHVNNRALLVDDICDSLWTICAKISMSSIEQAIYDFSKVKNAKTYPRDNNMIINEIKHHQSKSSYPAIVICLLVLAYYNSIKIKPAFAALIEENMSKLNFPIGMIEEVLRDGKLQKKDLQGNLYPWYRPADFSMF